MRTIRAGHPWLYAEAVEAPRDLEAGEVDVVESGRFVARGLYDPDSPISVRVWTTDPGQRVDGALVAARIATAAKYRTDVIDQTGTDSYRLFNGEGDRLPGMVCDMYGHTAVVQIDTAAVRPLFGHVVDALRDAVPYLRRVLLRSTNREARSRGDGVEALLGGLPENPVRVRETGVELEVDLLRGHKTGFYLDQRDNRSLVRRLASDRRVLDVFSYTGGFALSAALGGAVEVTAVDVAQPALDAARRNFAINDLNPNGEAFRFVAADAFEFLTQDRATYELVVLDPPSMASSAAGVEAALSAYLRLNTLALARLGPGGLLLTASCSSHVTEAHLVAVLRDAAVGAGRSVRILAHRGAGLDHPVLPAFPEGRYLSVLLVGAD